MHTLSLKLKDNIFEETERIIRKQQIPRNAYLNKAVDMFNQLNRRAKLRSQLAKESSLVRCDSLEILGEMEKLEDMGKE